VKAPNKYFTEEEIKETLRGVYKPSQKTTIRTHTYESGATYQGAWLGGFRHGNGKMNWPDGASYEGEWNFGHAHGQGKFIHADGDIY